LPLNSRASEWEVRSSVKRSLFMRTPKLLGGRSIRDNSHSIRLRKSCTDPLRTTPGSCPTDRVSPNRLDRKFTARAPNRKWVTDLKYVRTSAGWLYLAPVIDLFSRRVVGCAMSTEQDGKLSVAALTSALEARGNPRNVIVHSDCGGIYGDEDYVEKASAHRLRRSMSRTSNPRDNAVIESFFSTLTDELLDRERYGSPDSAQRSIAEWIDDFYNTQRKQTSLGDMSPIKYELACQMRKRRT
jgi:putative transposase